MNNNHALVKIWNVIYPILIYYVVSNVVMYLAILALGVTEESYVAHYTLLQTIATAAALPVIQGYYRRDKLLFTVFHQRMGNELKNISKQRRILNAVLTFICGAITGVVLNNLIGATGLTEISSGYQNVTAHFFGGSVFFEILGVGILVPIVEELLYRGVVYARLSDWVGIPRAALMSALIFGGLHLNIVQFVYAFLMGLLLVYFLEKSHNLYGAILGHIGANLITVLRTEYGILDWMENSLAMYWGSTLVLAVLSIGMILVLRNSKDFNV